MNLSALFEVSYKEKEPLSRHTTFAIGGRAAHYLQPRQAGQLFHILHTCQQENLPYEVIGNGSNILFADADYPGVVVDMKGLGDLAFFGNTVTAGAGVLLPILAQRAAEEGFSGLEFLAGIPGTVGGAVAMNAGAFGREIADVFQSAQAVWMPGGRLKTLLLPDMAFGNRESLLSAFPSQAVILSACFYLTPAPREEIKERMAEYRRRRAAAQPAGHSAGSIFRRPKIGYAGQMIEACGLKGRQVGGAEISEKHAGFILNRGGATAQDVETLIAIAKGAVFARFGVELIEEIKRMPTGREKDE